MAQLLLGIGAGGIAAAVGSKRICRLPVEGRGRLRQGLALSTQQHGQLLCQRHRILLLAQVQGCLLQARLHRQGSHQRAGKQQHPDQHLDQTDATAGRPEQGGGAGRAGYVQWHAPILI